MHPWRLIVWLPAMLLTMLAVAPGKAQLLRGEWVDQAAKRIEQCRKVDIRLIVLDGAGKPAAGAELRVRMQRHAFVWGLRLELKDLDHPAPLAEQTRAPVYRCFNGVSLAAMSAWPSLEPLAGRWDDGPLVKALDWCRSQGAAVRWGGVMSADGGRLPPWVAKLEGPELRDALEHHVRRVAGTFDGRVDQFDLVTETLDGGLIDQRLGRPMVRRLYELAKVTAPRSRLVAAFSDCLGGERLQAMAQAVTRMRDDCVPVDALALDTRLSHTILQGPLTHDLQWIGSLGLPVAITNLEVAGATPSAAAINLETALWAFFSTPAIEGVWFGAIGGDGLSDPTAALIDSDGHPTPAGEVFDKLVHGLWWTDQTATCDTLGNAKLRVFAGVYRIEARLPDGATARTTLLLPPGAGERVVMLEPLTIAEK